jgi:hypothetical protein
VDQEKRPDSTANTAVNHMPTTGQAVFGNAASTIHVKLYCSQKQRTLKFYENFEKFSGI